MAPLFHVDLKEIAQIVLARRGEAEVALLLDRRRLGVALRHDDAAQVGAMLARHVLPHRLALVFAEADAPVLFRLREEDAPAVVWHLHVAEIRPAVGQGAHCRAQVDVEVLRALGAHVLPPAQVVGLPVFECPLQGAVFGQVDVVGDLVGVVDVHRELPCSPDEIRGWALNEGTAPDFIRATNVHTRFLSNCGLVPLP